MPERADTFEQRLVDWLDSEKVAREVKKSERRTKQKRKKKTNA